MNDPDELVQAIADGLTIVQAAKRFGVTIDADFVKRAKAV